MTCPANMKQVAAENLSDPFSHFSNYILSYFLMLVKDCEIFWMAIEEHRLWRWEFLFTLSMLWGYHRKDVREVWGLYHSNYGFFSEISTKITSLWNSCSGSGGLDWGRQSPSSRLRVVQVSITFVHSILPASSHGLKGSEFHFHLPLRMVRPLCLFNKPQNLLNIDNLNFHSIFLSRGFRYIQSFSVG